jgi:hypothetical protein
MSKHNQLAGVVLCVSCGVLALDTYTAHTHSIETARRGASFSTHTHTQTLYRLCSSAPPCRAALSGRGRASSCGPWLAALKGSSSRPLHPFSSIAVAISIPIRRGEFGVPINGLSVAPFMPRNRATSRAPRTISSTAIHASASAVTTCPCPMEAMK